MYINFFGYYTDFASSKNVKTEVLRPAVKNPLKLLTQNRTGGCSVNPLTIYCDSTKMFSPNILSENRKFNV